MMKARTTLKAPRLVVWALVAALATGAAAAQEQGAGQIPARDPAAPAEKISYFSTRVYKVRDYKDSYVVTYAKHDIGSASLVISKEWYRQNPQKLKFRRTTGVIFPYMSVYYTDGEFNHIKLTVPLARVNPVWGWIPTSNPNVPDPVPDNFPQFDY
jgi:hypothetical protein